MQDNPSDGCEKLNTFTTLSLVLFFLGNTQALPRILPFVLYTIVKLIEKPTFVASVVVSSLED